MAAQEKTTLNTKDQHVTYFAYTPQTSRGYGTLKKINKNVYKYLIEYTFYVIS